MSIIPAASRVSRLAVLAALPIFALAACGGHKDNTAATAVAAPTPSGPNAAGFWTTNAQANTRYTGSAQTATLPTATSTLYTYDGGSPTVTLATGATAATFATGFNTANVGSASSAAANDVTLKQGAGTLTFAGLPGTVSTGTTTTATATAPVGSALTVNSFGGSTTPNSPNLNYSDFGNWNVAPTSTYMSNLGAFATGTVTPTASMPTTGTGSYAGAVAGYVGVSTTLATAAIYAFSGTLNLNVDFGAQTVSGGTTTTALYSVGTAPAYAGTMNNLNFTLTPGTTKNIVGNSFSGTVTPALTQGSVVSISGATGTFAGNFFGPATPLPPEAAGTFQLSGGPNAATVIGSFGVHK